ncbi:MAG: hypothetical protein C0173_08020 [Desulfurella sp.]|uniref:DUF4337 domain-containing protein n=1 Tax=Desulfurella sp. TaxID=1962857 RepID=UPI000CC66669|nr:DUF4337 domain-containing protein [Desulfurella sp.]PMP87991.1 MAG: hypothetical protein C0173_08020 [Desulfurella sp.]
MESPVEEKSKELIEEALKEASQKNKWLFWVSLTTTFMAILAALVGLNSELYITQTILNKNDAVLMQNKASDTWGYYQAKVIRENMYSIAYDLTKKEKFKLQAQRYSQEKKQIKQDAQKLEKKVKEFQEKSNHNFEKHHKFLIAQIIIQLSIAVASISAITRRKIFWYVSLLSFTAGLLIFLVEVL